VNKLWFLLTLVCNDAVAIVGGYTGAVSSEVMQWIAVNNQVIEGQGE